jgi:hypothetical protein
VSFSAAVLFASLATVSSPDIIREARGLGAQASSFAQSRGAAKQMFMEGKAGQEGWQRMAGDEDHLADGEWSVISTAFYWRREKAFTFVAVSKSSPSGDWFSTGEYSYRADGTLARLLITYSAYSPIEGALRREITFDRFGEQAHQGVKVTTLDGKALMRGPSAVEFKGYQPDYDLWLTTDDLPFGPLIRG